MKYSLQDLNEPQRKAVTAPSGRLLILAGAGSGKTRVVTTRIGYLISEMGVKPESILGLTFTNKAAEEMRVRLSDLIDPKIAKKVMLCTFHSFCMYVLRKEAHHLGYTENFSLYDRQDMVRLLGAIARDILEHEGKELPSLANTLDALASAKNKGIHFEEIQGTGSKWHDGFCKEVGKKLHESMKAYNAVDFDHLLWLVKELFEGFPEVLSRYQARFQHVLIDEYQDTNPTQARIAELLTDKSQNLCVVGDDDQSIYSWRGADVQNILRFDNATIVKLEQNFRSTSVILEAANALIHCNSKRHGKKLWSNKGKGQPIEVFYAPNEASEAEAVVSRLLKMKERMNLDWGDFAILYRSNVLSRAIESALLRASFITDDRRVRTIPYEVYGGDEFYEHKEIKDLVAYLRVVSNEDDHEGLLRIINYPRRGIGEVALNALVSHQRSEGKSLWKVLEEVKMGTFHNKESLSEKALTGILQLHDLISWAKERVNKGNLGSFLQELLKKLSFQDALFEEVKSDTMRKKKLENIEQLVQSLQEFEKVWIQDGKSTCLSDFVATMLLENESAAWNKSSKHDKDHVHLMTFHSAKGLEFASCFLIGLEDHLIPHERSLKEGSLEEERRLLYVAMTRARQTLTLSMAATRKRMGTELHTKPSRFLNEIPKELFHATSWR